MPATITRGRSHTATEVTEEPKVTAETNATEVTEEATVTEEHNGSVPATGDAINDANNSVLSGLLTNIEFPKAARGGAGKPAIPMDMEIVAMLEQSLASNGAAFRLFKGTNGKLISTLTGPSATPAKWFKEKGIKATHRLEVTNITSDMLEDNPNLRAAVGDAPLGQRSPDKAHKDDRLVVAWRVVRK